MWASDQTHTVYPSSQRIGLKLLKAQSDGTGMFNRSRASAVESRIFATFSAKKRWKSLAVRSDVVWWRPRPISLSIDCHICRGLPYQFTIRQEFHASVVVGLRVSNSSAFCTSTSAPSGSTIITKPRVGLWTTATCNGLDWYTRRSAMSLITWSWRAASSSITNTGLLYVAAFRLDWKKKTASLSSPALGRHSVDERSAAWSVAMRRYVAKADRLILCTQVPASIDQSTRELIDDPRTRH